MRERYGDVSLDSIPESDRLSSLKRQYETLLDSILTDHKSHLSRIRLEREQYGYENGRPHFSLCEIGNCCY